MTAYLESRGMPIKRGTNLDDLERSEKYATDKLKEHFSDDPDYQKWTTIIEGLASRLDVAWREKSPVSPILQELSVVHKQRNKTNRALYAGIAEGIQWRRDLIGRRNESLQRYQSAAEKEIGKTVEGMSQKTQDQIKEDLERFIASSYPENSPGHLKMQAVAETVAAMTKMGEEHNTPELRQIAAHYYLAFERSLYGRDEVSPISELYAREFTPEEARDGRLASVQAVETPNRSYQIFKVGDKFVEAPLEERVLILSHELIHKIDRDTMGVPESFGDETFAYGVSTESAAHVFQLQIYQKLKEINPNFSDPEMENLAKLVKGFGLVGLLQYGMAYAQIYRNLA